jgi:hypothetical protein
MTSLTLPDLNVWLALSSVEHIHRDLAQRWWDSTSDQIAFCRYTQMGLLRLVTTAAAMKGNPLSLDDAWLLYDRFFRDIRVIFAKEPPDAGTSFRQRSGGRHSSPKLLGDAWLLAFAEASGGKLLTFDRALAARGAQCLL